MVEVPVCAFRSISSSAATFRGRDMSAVLSSNPTLSVYAVAAPTDGWSARLVAAGAIEKNARTREADQECLQLLAIRSQALKLQIHASNEFTFSNQHQTAVSSFWVLMVVTHQCCPVFRDMFCFSMLCLANPFQNVSSFDIFAGRPVITRPVWPSPVIRMAVPLFGWAFEAYPCSALCCGQDASIVHIEKAVGLAGHFWLQQLASLIPGNLAKCGVNSVCRITPCPQVILKFTTPQAKCLCC